MVSCLTFLQLKSISGKKQIMELINDKICCYKCRPGPILRFFLNFRITVVQKHFAKLKIVFNKRMNISLHLVDSRIIEKRESISCLLNCYHINKTLFFTGFFFPWRWKDDVLEGAIILILQAIFLAQLIFYQFEQGACSFLKNSTKIEQILAE